MYSYVLEWQRPNSLPFCYLFVGKADTFEGAKHFCEHAGGTLATFDSEYNENLWVAHWLQKEYGNSYCLHQEVMLSVAFTYLFVYVYDNSKSNEQIFLNFFMWVGPDKRKK